MNKYLVPLLIFLTACAGPGTPPAPTLVTVQYTDSTQNWLPGLYSCASEYDTALVIETRALDHFDPSVQLSLRLGEPDEINSSVYQIGTEEIVIVVHPKNPVQGLALADLRAMFSGEIRDWSEVGGEDIPIQVWTFGPSEDIRRIFDSVVMLRQPISSQARLAVSADSMAAGVGADPGAIGFMPRSLVGSGVQIIDIEAAPPPLTVPVLILASPDAGQISLDLAACMQNK